MTEQLQHPISRRWHHKWMYTNVALLFLSTKINNKNNVTLYSCHWRISEKRNMNKLPISHHARSFFCLSYPLHCFDLHTTIRVVSSPCVTKSWDNQMKSLTKCQWRCKINLLSTPLYSVQKYDYTKIKYTVLQSIVNSLSLCRFVGCFAPLESPGRWFQ